MKRQTLIIASAFAILTAQAVSSRVLKRQPFLPSPPPLSALPLQMGDWSETGEETIEPEALAMLGPDDSTVRIYRSPDGGEQAQLFVAYYKTQLRAKNAHDPKVCLPGAGWNPIESRSIRVSIPGSKASFPANYYRVKKGDTEEVVLYWFQTRNAVLTLEQQLRAYKIWNAILENRTDMALVRIVVPVTTRGTPHADSGAEKLAAVVYTQMRPYFPPSGKVGT